MRPALSAGRISSPDSTLVSNPWPLPETPAMPIICPELSVILISFKADCCGSGGVRLRPLIDKTGMLLSVDSARSGRAISCPIISLVRVLAVSLRGSTTPTTLPARITVATSHNARISSSLCEMKMMPMPVAARLRSVSNSRVMPCGGRTEVGSSMIKRRGSCRMQRKISMRWRSPTVSECTVA